MHLCPWAYSSFSETVPAKGMKQRFLLGLLGSLAQPQPRDCACFAGVCGQGGTGSDSEGSRNAVLWLRAERCTVQKEWKAARASNGNAARWVSPQSLCQFKQWLTELLVITSPNISSKQEESITETNHSRWTLVLNVVTTAFTRQQIYAGIPFTHCQGTTHMQVQHKPHWIDSRKLKITYLQ